MTVNPHHHHHHLPPTAFKRMRLGRELAGMSDSLLESADFWLGVFIGIVITLMCIPLVVLILYVHAIWI